MSGLYSYSLCFRCEKDIETIKDSAIKLCKEEIVGDKVSFKVRCKRADKRYSITSPELNQIVSGAVLSSCQNLVVDVHNPEKTLNVEVRNEGCFMYTTEIRGMGGFPVGVAGKGLVMLSGGIDSPVCGILAMKQGIEIECIHFESTPLTSIESAQKVVDLLKKCIWLFLIMFLNNIILQL